jgi:hypothetical protein
MGYYTRFEIEISGTGPRSATGVTEPGVKIRVNAGLNPADIIKEITALAGDVFDGDTHKWYHYPEHMKTISRRHPALLFTLSGVGEEHGDFWREYHLGGKSQKAAGAITYADYDPEQLK